MAVLVEAVRWKGDAETGLLELLEQRLLPLEETYLTYDCPIAAAGAITDMVVRGAPAIGLAAAYAAVLAAQPRNLAKQSFEAALQVIADSRPTGVTLHWAVDRVQRLVAVRGLDASALLGEAQSKLMQAMELRARHTAEKKSHKPERKAGEKSEEEKLAQMEKKLLRQQKRGR